MNQGLVQSISQESERFSEKWLNVFANKVRVHYYGFLLPSKSRNVKLQLHFSKSF